MRRPGNIAGTGFALLLVAGGCSPSPQATPMPVAAPTGLPADHLLLAVEEFAGMPPWAAIDMPRRITLLSGGTLIIQEPLTHRLVPSIKQTPLDRAALDRVWAGALDAGLAKDARLEVPGLFDAETTLVHLDNGQRTTLLSIYGLGIEGDGPGDAGPAIPAAEVALRRRVRSYLAVLRRLVADEPFWPPAIALWVGSAGDGQAFPRVLPWTAALDLGTVGEAVVDTFWQRCVVLDGGAAREVLEIGLSLPLDAAVAQGAQQYRVGIRPIMPDEVGRVGCDRP
jgi:hypothetical protein